MALWYFFFRKHLPQARCGSPVIKWYTNTAKSAWSNLQGRVAGEENRIKRKDDLIKRLMSTLRKWSLNYEPKRINESYQLTSEETDIPGIGSHFVQLTQSNPKDTWKQGGVWKGGCTQTIQSSEAKTKRVSSSLQVSNGNTESAKLRGMMEAESHILASSSGFHPAARCTLWAKETGRQLEPLRERTVVFSEGSRWHTRRHGQQRPAQEEQTARRYSVDYGYPKCTALFLVPIARRMLVSHSQPCAESEDGVWEEGQGTFCVNRFHSLELSKEETSPIKGN